MPQYDAGTSVGKYVLQADAAIKDIQRLIKGYQDLAKVAGFKPPPIPASGGAAAHINAAAIAQQKLALASNQAARAAQALATEQNKTAREAANTASAQDRAAKSALALAAAQTRAANASKGGTGPALPRTFAGFTPEGFNQAAGAFGLATLGPQVIGQTIQFGIESGKAALQLRETKNSLRAVAGDMATYNQTLAAAKQQQVLFGGTLQENIEGLSGLTITARSSGASLQSLIGLSQRLAVLDPAQGAAGARIALNEALSGDPTSLAKRYEIPRAALVKLRDTTLPVEERLKVIDSFLNKVGITAESVAGRIDQDALAFRNLNAEVEAASIGFGDRLASAFSGAATGLGRVIGLINGNPQAIAQLNAILGSGPTDVGQVQIERRVTGVTDAAEAARQARLAAATPDSFFGTFDSATFDAQQAALDQAKNQLVVLGASSDEMRDKVIALYAEFARTGSVNAFLTGVRNLAGEINHGSKATDDARSSFAALREEMQKSAQASIHDTAQKNAQQAITSLLAEKSRLVVDQFLALNPTIDASAAASLAAANGYDPQIRKLITLAVEARNATNALGALNGGGVTEGRAERDTPGERAQARTAGLQLVRDQALAQTQAERDRLNRTGTLAQKLKQAEQDVAKAATPRERFEAETKLIELRQQAAALADKAGKAGVSAAEKQLSLEERIRDAKIAQLKAALDVQKSSAQDTLDRLKEHQEAAKAQRVLNSPTARADLKEAAAARLQIITADQQLRRLDIDQKSATAGGAIIGGRIFQSRAGGVPSGPVPTGGPAVAPGAAQGAAGAGGLTVVFQVGSKEIAREIIPLIVADLRGGLRTAQSAGA